MSVTHLFTAIGGFVGRVDDDILWQRRFRQCFIFVVEGLAPRPILGGYSAITFVGYGHATIILLGLPAVTPATSALEYLDIFHGG